MGLLEFKIQLSNPNDVFFSNQMVSGQIIVHLSEPKKLNKLKVELRGVGEVQWAETEQRNEHHHDRHSHHRRHSGEPDNDVHTHPQRVIYRAYESYVEAEAVLFHGPSLGPGLHVFPFHLTLPPSLPSSFEGTYGHVRYHVQAVIVRSWKWNHRVKKFFTLCSILDLNMYNSTRNPGHSRDHKNFCCFCCKSGPVSAVISTNRTGYVSGETIRFSAEIDNQSDKVMNGSFVQLIENVVFRAEGRQKLDRRVVIKQSRGQVNPGESDNWEQVGLSLPPLPPTKLGGSCNIIDVQYVLELHVDPSGIGFDLVVSLPITIGTIPLQEYISYMTTPVSPAEGIPPAGAAPRLPPGVVVPLAGAAPGSFPGVVVPPTTGFPPGLEGLDMNCQPSLFPAPAPTAPPLPINFSTYPGLPPPYYSESVWGEVTVRESGEEGQSGSEYVFAPKYVTYGTNNM